MTTINPNQSDDFTPTTIDPNGPDPDLIPEPAPVAVETPDDPEKKASKGKTK